MGGANLWQKPQCSPHFLRKTIPGQPCLLSAALAMSRAHPLFHNLQKTRKNYYGSSHLSNMDLASSQMTLENYLSSLCSLPAHRSTCLPNCAMCISTCCILQSTFTYYCAFNSCNNSVKYQGQVSSLYTTGNWGSESKWHAHDGSQKAMDVGLNLSTSDSNQMLFLPHCLLALSGYNSIKMPPLKNSLSLFTTHMIVTSFTGREQAEAHA